jgi:hypothetical protein
VYDKVTPDSFNGDVTRHSISIESHRFGSSGSGYYACSSSVSAVPGFLLTMYASNFDVEELRTAKEWLKSFREPLWTACRKTDMQAKLLEL